MRLDRSPSVNRELLGKAARLTSELERFGVDTIPSYNLAPALGGRAIPRPPRHAAWTVQVTVVRAAPAE